PRDDEIVELAVGNRDRTLDDVVPRYLAVGRIAEAHHRLATFGNRRQRLAWLRPPGTVVARLLAGGALAFAHGFDFLWRGIAEIGAAVGQHFSDDFAVAVHALHLVERTFVMLQTQPLHAVDDGLHGFRRRAFEIGIFDAQDELTAEMAGIGPREKRGTGAANVEEAGWAGGEACTNRGTDCHGK